MEQLISLAGLPESLLKRANEILALYENSDKKQVDLSEQLSLNFEVTKEVNSELKDYINELDILNTTPMEALNILFKIKEMNKKD